MNKTKKIASGVGIGVGVFAAILTGLHIFGIKDPTSFEYLLWELNVRGAIKIEGSDETKE